MHSPSIFITISRFIPDVKKMCINQWLGKYCIVGKIWAKQGVEEQVWFVPNTVGVRGFRGSCNPKKMLQFLPSFKLGNNICSTIADTKVLYKYEHFFFWKIGSLIIMRSPSLLYKHTAPERLFSQSNKVRNQRDLKNLNFPAF